MEAKASARNSPAKDKLFAVPELVLKSNLRMKQRESKFFFHDERHVQRPMKTFLRKLLYDAKYLVNKTNMTYVMYHNVTFGLR